MSNEQCLLDLSYSVFKDNVAHEDLTKYFDTYLTPNLAKDCLQFDNTLLLNDAHDAGGITIPPSDKNPNITILIQYSADISAIYLHELTHMYDMVLFSRKYCNCILSEIKLHPYYETFILWSEFHAKLIDIPYLHLITDIISGRTDHLLNNFINEINTYYFPKYTQKFISKKHDFQMRDIMWYIGEIVVCNTYDKKNIYNIPDDIKLILSGDIQPLYDKLHQCKDFDGFVDNISTLYFNIWSYMKGS